MIPTTDENALTETSSEPGIVLLDFWQEACAPRRAWEPRMERFTREHSGAFRAYRIDVDAHPEFTNGSMSGASRP